MACYSYTVHCCSNALASKFGSSIIFRRAAQPKPLVVQLILSRDICSATSENLSKILNIYGSRLRKNASKTAKIKAILKLDAVKNYISEQDAKDIEKKCDEMDVKRRARSANAEQDEDEDEEQPEALGITMLSFLLNCYQTNDKEKSLKQDLLIYCLRVLLNFLESKPNVTSSCR